MFVVSAGMPKSGSTLLCFYLTLLVGNSSGWGGRSALIEWIAKEPDRGSGEFLHDGWFVHDLELMRLAEASGPFVVKTHEAPPATGLPRGRVVVVSIRDPRDVVLSAMDHGRRSLARGSAEFVQNVDEDECLRRVSVWCDAALRWLEIDAVSIVRYENLVAEPETVLVKLAPILGADPSLVNRALIREQSERGAGTNRFNTGLVSRHDNEMSEALRAKCDDVLGEYISAMGYDDCE